MKKKIGIILCAVLVVVAAVAAIADELGGSGEKDAGQAEGTQEEEASGNMDAETKSGLTKEQQKIQTQIEAVYNVEDQQAIADRLDDEKKSQEYTFDNMLIEYNPFGTNTQSLYVYFNTDEAVSISYNIHVDDEEIDDFRRDVWQENTYTTEHEFQVIGLIPDMENTITFFLTREDGSTDTKEIVYEMGSLLGTEEVMLDSDFQKDSQKLEDGLYVVLGNDSDALDFMYYYDNQGVLRGEIPIIGYRSHRLLFDENSVYFSISETELAQMNRLGQVTNVYDLGNYKLHQDYVFDDNGNMLILGTDTTRDSVEDIVLRLDVESGAVTEVLDLGDLFGDFKEETFLELEEADYNNLLGNISRKSNKTWSLSAEAGYDYTGSGLAGNYSGSETHEISAGVKAAFSGLELGTGVSIPLSEKGEPGITISAGWDSFSGRDKKLEKESENYDLLTELLDIQDAKESYRNAKDTYQRQKDDLLWSLKILEEQCSYYEQIGNDTREAYEKGLVSYQDFLESSNLYNKIKIQYILAVINMRLYNIEVRSLFSGDTEL